MLSYKLTYFPIRLRAEVARQLLHLAGVPFDDIRVSNAEWSALKSKTAFGQLPILEVDGQPLPQSFAINRYLAKQFGFAGNTPFEAAWVDAIADQFKDYYNELRPFVAVLLGYAKGGRYLYWKPRYEITGIQIFPLDFLHAIRGGIPNCELYCVADKDQLLKDVVAPARD